MAPAMHSKVQMSKVMSGGKGFGGGEATRDPDPTQIDPNDPKGKQQAIHKAESFADYLARRKSAESKAGEAVWSQDGGVALASASSGSSEDTREDAADPRVFWTQPAEAPAAPEQGPPGPADPLTWVYKSLTRD